MNHVICAECPVCGIELTLEDDVVPGELKECVECGTELEIESVDPLVVSEAPVEDEGWSA